MKNLLKLEEAAMLVFGMYLFTLLGYQWWWFAILILAPDLSMLGYLGGNVIGAWIYNLFHHRGVAIGIYLLGLYLNNQLLQFAGIILFSHCCMDRLFGYGLKYEKGFRFTHLGEIGKIS
jgi:hypothetical protein